MCSRDLDKVAPNIPDVKADQLGPHASCPIPQLWLDFAHNHYRVISQSLFIHKEYEIVQYFTMRLFKCVYETQPSIKKFHFFFYIFGKVQECVFVQTSHPKLVFDYWGISSCHSSRGGSPSTSLNEFVGNFSERWYDESVRDERSKAICLILGTQMAISSVTANTNLWKEISMSEIRNKLLSKSIFK